MEYNQFCRRLSEEPLVVLQQVFREVSDIYETRVQNSAEEHFEPTETEELGIHDTGYSTAHSSPSPQREDTVPEEESLKSSEVNANTTKSCNRANENSGESGSNQSGEVMSADGAEAGGEDNTMSSRLRVRPTVKKITNKMYGIIVGADSLKRTKPHRHSLSPAVQPKIRWTKQMFKRLGKGVELYMNEGWRRVAQHVGGAVTAKQCALRWRTRAQFTPPPKMKRKWSSEEVTRLAILAKKHVIPTQWSELQQAMLPERVDWFLIAQTLKRSPKSCRQKYGAMQSKEQA